MFNSDILISPNTFKSPNHVKFCPYKHFQETISDEYEDFSFLTLSIRVQCLDVEYNSFTLTIKMFLMKLGIDSHIAKQINDRSFQTYTKKKLLHDI